MPNLRALRKKTAEKAICFSSKSEIETGWLDLAVFNRGIGLNHTKGDKFFNLLVGKNSLRRGTAHSLSNPPLSPLLHAPHIGWAPTIGSSRLEPFFGCG